VVELNLSGNQFEKLTDLRGMKSLLILKLSDSPSLTTIDIDRLPEKATVWLDGTFRHTVLAGIMQNMERRRKDGKVLPTLLFGSELVEKEEGKSLVPPIGWHVQRVAVKEPGVINGIYQGVAVEENEDGEFFIVVPPEERPAAAKLGKPAGVSAIGKTSKADAGPAQKNSGFSNRVRFAAAAAGLQESEIERAAREARKAIPQFVQTALSEWEAAFKKRADYPTLPTMPTVEVLCEELRKKHPEYSKHLEDGNLKYHISFRRADYLAEHEELAADINAYTTVTDFVNKTLSEWAAAFRTRKDDAKPPLASTIIESLCEKIGNTHSGINEQLGSEFVRNYVSNSVKLHAFDAMADFVKDTLSGWKVKFNQLADDATPPPAPDIHGVLGKEIVSCHPLAVRAGLPPTPVIIQALCEEMGNRHPDIYRLLGTDIVNEYVSTYAATHMESEAGVDVDEKALNEWMQEFRQRAATATIPSIVEVIEARHEDTGSVAEEDYDNFIDIRGRPSNNSLAEMSARSSWSSASSIAMMDADEG